MIFCPLPKIVILYGDDSRFACFLGDLCHDFPLMITALTKKLYNFSIALFAKQLAGLWLVAITITPYLDWPRLKLVMTI